VEDHARGIELILDKGAVGEVYNIGGNNEWANIDIVTMLCRIVDQAFETSPNLAEEFPKAPPASGKTSASLIAFIADRPGHDWRYAINAQKISFDIGFRPKVDFESGLKKTVNWFLEQGRNKPE